MVLVNATQLVGSGFTDLDHDTLELNAAVRRGPCECDRDLGAPAQLLTRLGTRRRLDADTELTAVIRQFRPPGTRDLGPEVCVSRRDDHRDTLAEQLSWGGWDRN
jgi:hypothetical protein